MRQQISPAPWRVYPHGCDSSHGLPIITKKNGHLIAIMADRNLANARVIAAAPELLEALREFIAWTHCPPSLQGTGHTGYLATLIEKATAAIAKAEK